MDRIDASNVIHINESLKAWASPGEFVRPVSIDKVVIADDALDALSASLEGAVAGASEAVYREIVTAAVPPGTEMVGFSPEAIAIAVVRAQQDEPEEGTDRAD